MNFEEYHFLLPQEKEIAKYKSEVLPKYLRNFEKQAGEKGFFVGDEVSSCRIEHPMSISSKE